MWHICVGVCSTHPPSLNTNKSFRKCLWTASARHSIKLPITNGKDLIHFCNCLNICMRVCVCGILSVLLTHMKKALYISFSPPSCSVAWQLPLCFGVSLGWWKWLSLLHTSHTSPFFQNHRRFVPASGFQPPYLRFAHYLNRCRLSSSGGRKGESLSLIGDWRFS